MGLVVANERLVQEVIALLVAVAVEGLLLRLILNRRVQRVDDSRNERTGNVADAEADDVSLRVGCGILADFARDGGEQIALLEIVIIGVDLHYFLLLFRDAATNALNRGCARFGRDLNSGWN